MPSRTIPEATAEDTKGASQAFAAIVFRNEGDMVGIHNATVAVIAQQRAEIRWLRNMLHSGENVNEMV